MFTATKKKEHHEIVKHLRDLGHSTDQLANNILAILVGGTVELSLGTLQL